MFRVLLRRDQLKTLPKASSSFWISVGGSKDWSDHCFIGQVWCRTMEGQWGNLSQTLAAIFPIYERQKWDIHGIKYLVCGPASISRYHRLVNCYSAQNLTATVDKEEQAPSIGYAWKQGFGKNDLKFLLLSWVARNKAWDCERETGYVCQFCVSVCLSVKIFLAWHIICNLQADRGREMAPYLGC